MKKINVLEYEINIKFINNENYVSITDMLKAKDGNFLISHWLRNRMTVEFLGVWEKIHNPNFNYIEFDIIKNQTGLNSYVLSVKEWVKKTNAIGIRSVTGRYGSTFAHPDIAFEFASWISVEFKLFLIKDYQRLKEIEQKQMGWDLKRTLSKINYNLHTDAIKNNLIPKKITKEQIDIIYANEADLINVALFGMTAKEWKEKNLEKKGNIRDYANVVELVCLVNLENLNSVYINENITQKDRLVKLNNVAIYQMKLLTTDKRIQKLEKISNVKMINKK
jgi:KilA-N domain.